MLLWVAPAVAWAAVASGIAGRIIDVEEYRSELEARLGPERQVMRGLITRAQQDPPSIVFPEGDDPRILRAARTLADEGIARPILLGDLDAMRRQADDASLTLEDIELVNPRTAADRDEMAEQLWRRRQRRGITLREARRARPDLLWPPDAARRTRRLRRRRGDRLSRRDRPARGDRRRAGAQARQRHL